MKSIFDAVSFECSKLTTRKYSTSFSLGIYFLDKSIHDSIYAIYGYVRLADEIVDSFHGYDKEQLMNQIRQETVESIERGISLNPILNAFQKTVNEYNIEWELIDTFLKSMEMDLQKEAYDSSTFEAYILGSAEVVGLMCLRVFVDKDDAQYQALKPAAMKLGSAFQKINFLRDLKADYEELGRSYFPEIDLSNFTSVEKDTIEKDIEADFDDALVGIKNLPNNSKMGVYLAYIYYRRLFNKIRKLPAQKIMNERIRISNPRKFGLMINSIVKYNLNIL